MAHQFGLKFPEVPIYFIPSSLSAHKSNNSLISSEQRIEMSQLALKETPWFFSDCEIKKGGVSSTADTIRYFYQNMKSLKTVYILIGDDLVSTLSSWRDYSYLQNSARFVVAARESVKADIPVGGVSLDNSLLDISSSNIRNLLQNKLISKNDLQFQLEKWIPDSVGEYILRKGLYGNDL